VKPHSDENLSKKPPWLKIKLLTNQNFFHTLNLLRERGLNTICQNAKCPNIYECWSQKTATFLILGTVCTRNCAFCAVKKGHPSNILPQESGKIAEAVNIMGLKYTVITSVTRDDLEDGGSSQFSSTLMAIKKRNYDVRVEVLIPDFKGNENSLKMIIDSNPDVICHNLEVPEALYPYIKRKINNYACSLKVLEKVKNWGITTKSGLIVGLGEKYDQILKTMKDLRNAGCDLLTIGQYLQPTKQNLPVKKFYSPFEFEYIKKMALDLGFSAVESGPLVRSSYMAKRMYESLIH